MRSQGPVWRGWQNSLHACTHTHTSSPAARHGQGTRARRPGLATPVFQTQDHLLGWPAALPWRGHLAVFSVLPWTAGAVSLPCTRLLRLPVRVGVRRGLKEPFGVRRAWGAFSLSQCPLTAPPPPKHEKWPLCLWLLGPS